MKQFLILGDFVLTFLFRKSFYNKEGHMKRAEFLGKISKMISKRDNPTGERDLSRVLGKLHSEHFLRSSPQDLNKLMIHKRKRSKRSKSKSKSGNKAKSLYSNFFLNHPPKKKKTSKFMLTGSHHFKRGIDLRYNKDFDKTYKEYSSNALTRFNEFHQNVNKRLSFNCDKPTGIVTHRLEASRDYEGTLSFDNGINTISYSETGKKRARVAPKKRRIVRKSSRDFNCKSQQNFRNGNKETKVTMKVKSSLINFRSNF